MRQHKTFRIKYPIRVPLQGTTNLRRPNWDDRGAAIKHRSSVDKTTQTVDKFANDSAKTCHSFPSIVLPDIIYIWRKRIDPKMYRVRPIFVRCDKWTDEYTPPFCSWMGIFIRKLNIDDFGHISARFYKIYISTRANTLYEPTDKNAPRNWRTSGIMTSSIFSVAYVTHSRQAHYIWHGIMFVALYDAPSKTQPPSGVGASQMASNAVQKWMWARAILEWDKL